MSVEKVLEANGTLAKPASCFGVRHLQAILLFFGLLLAFAMRVNMSMAIVAMTDSSKEDSFSWSIQTQSVILSSFFWGYVVLQIPGGVAAARWGGKVPVLLVVGLNSTVSLFIPIAAAYGGWYAVCTCRVLQGLSQGMLYPSMNCLISRWIPLEEKSRLSTLIYAGAQFGTAVQLAASGFLAESFGWQSIFYANGTIGAMWTVTYFILGAATPAQSKLISEEERNYIQTSLGQTSISPKRLPTPWKAIWTSPAFLALIIAHCGQNWGFWTLMTEMPSYMSKVLGVDIKANGVMSALPYLAMYMMSFPFGFVSDFVLKKKWLSTSANRKVSNSIGLWGPAIALIGLSYAPAGNITMAVSLLTMTVALNAGHYTGFMLVHLDMAPNFAGALMGITNCVANGISIVAPLAAGAILTDETDPSDWRKVFYLASLIYFLANLLFIFFGTSERQSWNEPAEDKSTTNNNNDTTGTLREKIV